MKNELTADLSESEVGQALVRGVGPNESEFADIESITPQQADVVVEVGPDGDFSTINDALEHLTNSKPTYTPTGRKAS